MTMVMILRLCLSLLLLVSPAFSQVCDQCFYTPDDAQDCKVYGKVDGDLTAWSQASTECLDQYDLVKASADPTTTCASGNSFVNAVRFNTLPQSIKFGLGDFFRDDGNGNPVLKDEIAVFGETFDCTASESTCYNAMKPYFDVEPGLSEKNQVCDTLFAQVANDREIEQTLVRNRVCQSLRLGEDVTECQALATQIAAKEVEYDVADRDCVFFSFGPGTSRTPECEGVNNGGGGGSLNTSNDSKAPSASSAMVSSLLLVAAIAVVWNLE